MKEIIDKFTGKPVPRTQSLLGTPNGQTCEHCGSECIDRCSRCGAPQCCPRCCAEDNGQFGVGA